MTSARQITRWTGVAAMLAGAVLALTELYYGFAPLTASWWTYSFNVFWGGIVLLGAGAAATLCAQYLMTEPVPVEERKRVELTA